MMLRGALGATCVPTCGLSRDDAAYIIDSIPIVRRRDDGRLAATTGTKAMILAYFNAPAAGDTTTDVAV